MKVLALILSVVIGTALLFGATLLITVTTPHRGPGLTLLGAMACTVLVYGPLTLGALTSYWDVRGSRYFRRFLVVVLAVEALGAVGIVLFAILAGSPAWVPVVVILSGAVLTAVALLVGRLLYRHSPAALTSGEEWSPISARDIQRRILIVAGVFVGAFAIGAIAFPMLLSDDSDRAGVVSSLGFALQFALLAGSITCIVLTIPLNRRLRSSVGGDLDAARRTARATLGRKPVELDADQQVAAARYAAIAPTALSFTLTYIVMLYGALLLQQARLTAEGRGLGLWIGSLILVAILVFFVPYYLVRIRRAQRYAREHADLLRTGQSSPR